MGRVLPAGVAPRWGLAGAGRETRTGGAFSRRRAGSALGWEAALRLQPEEVALEGRAGSTSLAAHPRRPVPGAWVKARGGGGSAPGCASVSRARAGGDRRRQIARRAAAWARRTMAAPEPAPRRGREREREEESEDESDILEESPCGRWQKRREQVGRRRAVEGEAGEQEARNLCSLGWATFFLHPFGLAPMSW